jgi:hypothetical protein
VLAAGGAACDSGPDDTYLSLEHLVATAQLQLLDEGSASGGAFWFDQPPGVSTFLEIEPWRVRLAPGTYPVRIYDHDACDPPAAPAVLDPTREKPGKRPGDVDVLHIGERGPEFHHPGYAWASSPPSFTSDALTAGTGLPNDVLGRIIVVHRPLAECTDEFVPDPGPWLACGRIEARGGGA